MQNKKKNKKLTEGEGFTLAQEQPLGLSIGALLGVPQKERADENEGNSHFNSQQSIKYQFAIKASRLRLAFIIFSLIYNFIKILKNN